MALVVEPATVKDFLDFSGKLPPHRCVAWAARLDGVVIGLGGLMILPEGGCLAFVDMKEEARQFHKTLHQTGLRFMRHARTLNLGPIYATTETGVPRADEWLERLGFEKREIGGSKVFVDAARASIS